MTLVGGRFEIDRVAGRGGMATVHRAHDRLTGGIVALKVMLDRAGVPADRFAREAEVLASLAHPSIVRYIAHGFADDGLPYIAMEWIEGETLAQVLRQRVLSARESVALAARVAEGLAAAHALGVVHRDVKPHNLILPGGRAVDVKLVDFGIAFVKRHESMSMTRTGALVGTPGYIAPEQARGQRGIDARADVFSLGCVLYECLSGRPPFVGESFMAVLAKILIEPVARLSEHAQGLPTALEDLVQAMLEKDPAARPADGRAVAVALDAIRDIGPSRPNAVVNMPTPSLTRGEQRLLTVVLSASADDARAVAGTALMQTMEHVGGTMNALRGEVARYGGQVERMLDGTVVVTMLPRGTATDQVAQAARCALVMRSHMPGMPIAIATGRGVVAGRLPFGEVIDRAARLVRSAQTSSGGTPLVRVDETTAGLLDGRFDIGGDGGGLVLRGEREGGDELRTLLGRAMPCVGREREIGALEDLFRESVSEPCARAALVVAPSGVGKSRVRAELLRRLAEHETRVEVWIARGDSMGAGASFGMVAQALRSAASVSAGEASAVRAQKLRARVARNVAPEETARVTAFLGEMIGVRANIDVPELRAAREDARLMGDQIRRAWEDFVAAECAVQPVVLVLEDLHWGDVASVQLVDSALRHAADRPLFVLAVARPEVLEVFPRIWEGRALEMIHLRELKRTSCVAMVREALGDVAPELLIDIVDRAAGNAFYLEELVRAVAEGRGGALPETVIAMVEARLEAIGPEARHVLRAASIFGQVFWGGGVAALLGGAERTLAVTDWLDELARREIITARRDTRFTGQREYVFRHAIVRETAYAMLTDDDRALGHRLAGGWLRAAGETSARVLAEHFELGRDRVEAADYYRAAALDALEGNDLAGAIALGERAVTMGAVGRSLGKIRLLQAEAHLFRAEPVEAEACARAALERLPRGTGEWLRAAGALAEAAGKRSLREPLFEARALVADVLPDAERVRDFAYAGARIVAALVTIGEHGLARSMLAAMLDAEPIAASEPVAQAWICNARSWMAMVDGDIGASLIFDRAVADAFESVDNLRLACEHRAFVGYDMLTLGAHAEAEVALREALATADRLGLASVAAMAMHNLGAARVFAGDFDAARAVEARAIAAYVGQGDRRMEGGSRDYLAMIHLRAGDLHLAEDEARRAIAVLDDAPPIRAQALSTLSRVLLEQGRLEDALEAATEAMRILELIGTVGEGDSGCRLAYAEALTALGRPEGKAAYASARAALLARADRITDSAWRSSFLERVPDHAQTIANS
jgi:tetratricopeptide (TPR) repeat protein